MGFNTMFSRNTSAPKNTKHQNQNLFWFCRKCHFVAWHVFWGNFVKYYYKTLTLVFFSAKTWTMVIWVGSNSLPEPGSIIPAGWSSQVVIFQVTRGHLLEIFGGSFGHPQSLKGAKTKRAKLKHGQTCIMESYCSCFRNPARQKKPGMLKNLVK